MIRRRPPPPWTKDVIDLHRGLHDMHTKHLVVVLQKKRKEKKRKEKKRKEKKRKEKKREEKENKKTRKREKKKKRKK